MSKAIEQIQCPYQLILTDAMPLSGQSCPVVPIIKGDAQCLNIAAASILAKVSRDRYMGIVCAINAARKAEGLPFLKCPLNTVTGELISYLLNASGAYFAPMNANWALFSDSSKESREETIMRSLKAIECYWSSAHA